jgi:hypothetical protein
VVDTSSLFPKVSGFESPKHAFLTGFSCFSSAFHDSSVSQDRPLPLPFTPFFIQVSLYVLLPMQFKNSNLHVGLLCCNAVWTCKWIPTIRRIIPPPFSGLKAVCSFDRVYLPTCTYGAATHKTNIDIFTATRTWNLVILLFLCSVHFKRNSVQYRILSAF